MGWRATEWGYRWRMNRRIVGWAIATALGLGLVAPIVACEADTPSTGGALPSFEAPDTGVPFTPPPLPEASTPTSDAGDSSDAAIEASVAPACNDGKLDPNETCDPLASCPNACPAISCQTRTLEGAGTCAAKCVDGPLQTACINGDGCCPPTCNKSNDDDCQVTCGNSIVEPGELCDPLASCPASCAPLGCQLRTLQGAGTCAARCVNSGMQTACVNGDGCCPAGCNAVNDTDCGPGCGNNVIEPGELCDPLASCPTACPPIQCQLRTLTNAGTCQAQCVNAGLQTACINNDGCCPAGCNANNDNDCTPTCGNNVVEKGETCDPLGSCPASCPQLACQLRKLDNAGTCQAACTPDGFQTKCVNNDGCCPAGCNANDDNDCKPFCGNAIVEKGETCDGKCPKCTAKSPYTCYEDKGSAATCDLVCNSPITTCGAANDKCCPFDSQGGCGSTTDGDCKGDNWKWVEWPTQIDTSKGCVNVVIAGIVPGGSYDITTCAPPGKATGDGDPDIVGVMDDNQVNYAVANADCTTPTALPLLAGSNCNNTKGQQVMACSSPSPGGFMADAKASAFTVRVCPGAGGPGTTPLFVWFNAPEEPKPPVKK
jgi:hypothetical protein